MRVRRKLDSATRGRNQHGGAISLWVVLMVPVSAFAAVVAMAGPQRVAAESSMQDAADDLAMLAVAWRDGQGVGAGVRASKGSLHAFPPECDNPDQPTHYDADIVMAEQAVVTAEMALEAAEALNPPDLSAVATAKDVLLAARLSLGDDDPPSGLKGDRVDLRAQWKASCELLFESMMRDLGYLGVNPFSLQGFYSDSLAESATQPPMQLPCSASDDTVAMDAVHVALAADWEHAGWAAAQVWPRGIRVAAESVGRLSRHDTGTTPPNPPPSPTPPTPPSPTPSRPPPCAPGALSIHDERGRPRLEPTHASRELTRSVPRTPISN